MEITTKVCDICYFKGTFNESKKLHDCGELGDLCDEHFKEAYNYLTGQKKKNVLNTETTLLQSNNKTYVAKGTDVNTGEEVAVTFDSTGKAEASSDYTDTPRKRLPWL